MRHNLNVLYTLQQSGSNSRVLRTLDGADTVVVTTVGSEVASVLRDDLQLLVERRCGIFAAALAADGQVCFLRRQLLAAFDGPVDAEAAMRARSPYAGGLSPAEVVAPVAATVAGCSDAVRRTVRDELASLTDGTEDVLVPLDIHAEDGQYICTELLNDWLEQASDELVVAAVEDFLEVRYDEVAHFYADRDDVLYEWMGHYFLELSVSEAHIRAWVGRHRPALADQLEASA